MTTVLLSLTCSGLTMCEESGVSAHFGDTCLPVWLSHLTLLSFYSGIPKLLGRLLSESERMVG